MFRKYMKLKGGLQGTNHLVTFGMKLDIMFKKVSVNVLTGISTNVQMLAPGKTGHAPFNSSSVCSIKMPYFLSNGGGILKFKFQ